MVNWGSHNRWKLHPEFAAQSHSSDRFHQDNKIFVLPSPFLRYSWQFYSLYQCLFSLSSWLPWTSLFYLMTSLYRNIPCSLSIICHLYPVWQTKRFPKHTIPLCNPLSPSSYTSSKHANPNTQKYFIVLKPLSHTGKLRSSCSSNDAVSHCS